MATTLKQVFRMKEGTNESSYAKASYLQKEVLSLTKPLREKAIREFYYRERPTTLCIADLGCSSVELSNLSPVFGLLESVENARRELGKEPQEYQIYLNDLPGNDFNTIFRSLGSFGDKLKQEMGDDFGHHFVNGAPGSFYGRLFASNHLHFIHSSYSLHWLSQVPKGIEDNKGNINIAKTSPPHVIKAYYEQFERDFWSFLRYRSEEVVVGGMMVLTLIGRKTREPYSRESCYWWEILASALKDMVVEGSIDEDKLNTFNTPFYAPSEAELGFLVEKEGSFNLNNQVQISEVSWKPNEQHKNSHPFESDHDAFTKCIRAVTEYLITSHFGESIVEEVYHKYKEFVKVSMGKENNVFINITVSLTRKG
ncbi:S-adenosyl-L-methionine:benzoic acid/salicylic acid carboxyl methyltransferase 1 [Beta vulgaris subsp. vulgaris]|uniref:S-adenosyl-L-methionine:benzoic acid/salicylic acid carboxyl methyltransferase 1 n=1 Tax=Beta vulgaris subsp. vulgaris TaxID=3555 RepID=UPI002036F0F5|nr:S-adenosyl-L-methionine:benzoic acid/salicylic acid carboxyl methyltransferase 1 [Beta vulgaris subsp. vulgaris]